MRLIDADELKKVICNNYDCGIGLYTLIDLINNAPTVTPTIQLKDITDEDVARFALIWQRATSKGVILEPERPQGEWLKCQNDMFRCSNCSQADEVPTAMGNPIYNFCPNCGADMRKGGAK